MRFTMVELSPSGGIFQFSYQLGAHLAAQGHTVELLTGPDPELTSDTPAFTVRPVLPTWHAGSASPDRDLVRRARRVLRGARHVGALASTLRHLRRRRPDAVLWHPLRFPLDSVTVVAARRLLPETVQAVVLHEPRPLRQQGRTGALYTRSRVVLGPLEAAVRAMDVIFVLGDRARDDVLETFSPPGRVEVVEHGDEGVFVRGDGAPSSADTTDPRVVFFGTWRRTKGLDVLLDAFARVRERVPDASLVVAGAVGASVDYADLERRARQVPGVELRPGYVPMDEVPSLVSSGRVVAVPYLSGNQSGVVHLAQTFARPVVATEVGDIPSAVPDGEAGVLVPPGDPEALAEALQRLLEDPAEARRLGRGGHERLRQQGSWAQTSSEVAAAVEKAAAARGLHEV